MFSKNRFLNEFTVVGIFVAIAAIGLAAGAISLLMTRSSVVQTVTSNVSAPSMAEYRAQTKAITTPFLSQIGSVNSDNLSAETVSALNDLINQAQTALLRLQVPGSERDAHLSFVILLDQWHAAISGGVGSDLSGVRERTTKVLADYPWISPTSESL